MTPAPDSPPSLPSGATLPPAWPDAAMVQWIRDSEHLRLLSIFHYIVGGLAILFSCFFIFYIFFGAMILSQPRFFETPARSLPSFSPTPAASPDETPDEPAVATPTPHPTHRTRTSGDAPPAFIGYLLVGIGSAVVLFGWTVGALLIYSGLGLAQRKRRVFSMVMAALSCLQIPFGTILGVFTLVVLQRPTVRALYAADGPK